MSGASGPAGLRARPSLGRFLGVLAAAGVAHKASCGTKASIEQFGCEQHQLLSNMGEESERSAHPATRWGTCTTQHCKEHVQRTAHLACMPCHPSGGDLQRGSWPGGRQVCAKPGDHLQPAPAQGWCQRSQGWECGCPVGR